MTQQKLSEYAKLVIQVGVNLQKGQTLLLACPVECASFGRMVAEEAYKAGARDVVLRWQDDQLERMRYLHADDAVFDEVPAWLKSLFGEYTNSQTVKIIISASDPENLNGVPSNRIQRSAVTQNKAFRQYIARQIANEFQWCIVSVPTPVWAAKVFPQSSAGEAVDKLWDAILHTIYITGDGTAVERWKEHLSELNRRAERLNGYRFTRLIYKNGIGTDLTVELPEKHRWMCGGETTQGGLPFIANMPTEEIFTVPAKRGVNGVLYSSMPLSLDGNLVKDIKLTFADGKIVDADASEGLEVLLNKLDTDEGARFLGEVALVPHNSGISRQGILYYNTLFDENASCHFAFGKAIPAYADADKMTADELAAMGINDSIIHVDFMVGTSDLSIIGQTADGKEIPIFIDGNFVE